VQVPQQNNTSSIQKVVINQPGLRPGQPGSQITVPLATLQALQAGQGIPTGQPGHLLVKTETGQYQILRVGPPGQAMVPVTSMAGQAQLSTTAPMMAHQTPAALSAATTRLPSVPSPVQVMRQPMPVTTTTMTVRAPPPAPVVRPTATPVAAPQAPTAAAAQAK
jgi:transcription initiation factor TFIID subunit 4